MRKYQVRNYFSTKGFTLIELLVVIAIIGILAVVVVGNIGRARDTARDATISATMQQMRNEAELAALGNGGKYPNTVGLCPVSGALGKLVAAIEGLTGYTISGNDLVGNFVCRSDGNKRWRSYVLLPDAQTYYCTDATGFAGDVGATRPLASSYQCVD